MQLIFSAMTISATFVSGAIRRLICCQNVKATTKEERHNREMKHGH
jgi:hypothetical protein